MNSMKQKEVKTDSAVPEQTEKEDGIMMTAFGLDYNYKSVTQNRYKYINNVFLYGSLAKENKFDAVGVDLQLFNKLKKEESCSVEIFTALGNGTVHPSVLFWWHDDANRQHGLICRKDDTKSIAYAKFHMQKKASHLNYKN